MSLKRKTPKRKSKEEDILLKAVHQIVKHKKTPKSKTPKSKTPKQKGGKDDLWNQINAFFPQSKSLDGIRIESVLTPLNGNTDKSLIIKNEALKDEVITNYMNIGPKPKPEPNAKPNAKPESKKGGYGKKFINNQIRLYEGPEGNNQLFHSI